MDFCQISSVLLDSSSSNTINKTLITACRNFSEKIFKSVNEKTEERFFNFMFIVYVFFLLFFLARLPIAMTDQQLTNQANP
jgi:hypothetical protein